MPRDLHGQALAAFDRLFVGSPNNGERTAEAEPLDAYEPGTVLDPEDQEVLELLREIGEYERRAVEEQHTIREHEAEQAANPHP
jgi:hypothetical protein